MVVEKIPTNATRLVLRKNFLWDTFLLLRKYQQESTGCKELDEKILLLCGPWMKGEQNGDIHAVS